MSKANTLLSTIEQARESLSKSLKIKSNGDTKVIIGRVLKHDVSEEERDYHGRFAKSSDEKISDSSIGRAITFGKHGDIKVESLKDDKSPAYVKVTGTRLSDGKRVTIAASRSKSYPHSSGEKPKTSETEKPAEKKMPTGEELAKMRNIPGPLGSNGGQWKESEDGRKFLMKEMDDPVKAMNEVAAGEVYRIAGVPFPNTSIAELNGKTYVVSEKIEGLTPRSPSWWESHPEVQAQAARDFGIDALLSHWDVHGASGDNTLVDANGRPIRIEAGGAMAFRAQGAPKPDFYPGGLWVEPQSMRGSEQGVKMYGKIDNAQVADSLERAAKIDLSEVQKKWDDLGIPRNISSPWIATLRARQEVIPSMVAKLRDSIPKTPANPLQASDYPSGHLPENNGKPISGTKETRDPKILEQEKKNFSEEMKTRVPAFRISEDNLLKMIRDGRLKNQFETQTSGGALSPDLRTGTEAKVLGVSRSAAPTERPVYGYMSKIGQTLPPSGDDAQEVNVGFYGSVRVLLNDSVLSRSTVTLGDSLNELYRGHNIVGVPALIARDEPSRIPDNAITPLPSFANEHAYMELQMKDIRIADIKEVHFEIRVDTLTKALDEAGIKWSVGSVTKTLNSATTIFKHDVSGEERNSHGEWSSGDSESRQEFVRPKVKSWQLNSPDANRSNTTENAKAFNAWAKDNVTKVITSQKNAVAVYSQFGYKEVNSQLRSGKSLDEITFKSRGLPSEVKTYTASDIQKVILSSELKTNATVFRSMSTSLLENLKVGDVFEQKSFTSTTMLKGAAVMFDTTYNTKDYQGAGRSADAPIGVVTISLPAGTNAVAIAGNECELLLGAGARLRLDSIEPSAKGNRYFFSYVGMNEAVQKSLDVFIEDTSELLKYNEDQARDWHGRFGSGTSEKVSESSVGRHILIGSHGAVKIESLKDDVNPNYVRIKGTRLSDGKKVTIAASRKKEYIHSSAEKPHSETPAVVAPKPESTAKISDERAGELMRMYIGTFRYTPNRVDILHDEERSAEGRTAKTLFAYEMNARLKGKSITLNSKVFVGRGAALSFTQKQVDEAIKNVDDFMRAISERATTQEKIYRGLTNIKDDQFEKMFKVGKTVDMPVSSWTKSEGRAAGYADQGESYTGVVVVMLPGGKGASERDLSERGTVFPQIMSGGRFKVVSIDASQKMGAPRIVTVKQVDFVPKAVKQNWKTTDPNFFPNWFPDDFHPETLLADDSEYVHTDDVEYGDMSKFVKIGKLIKSDSTDSELDLDAGEILEDPDWVAPFWSTPAGQKLYDEFFPKKKVEKYDPDQARDSHGRFGSGTSTTISEDSKGHYVVLGSHGSVRVLSLSEDKNPKYVKVLARRVSDGKVVRFSASRSKSYIHHDKVEHARPPVAPKPKTKEPAHIEVIRKGVQKFAATGGEVKVYDTTYMSSKEMQSLRDFCDQELARVTSLQGKAFSEMSANGASSEEISKMADGFSMLRSALMAGTRGRSMIIATNTSGQIVSAMSIDISTGSYHQVNDEIHVGCLGSVHTPDARGGGTAIQYALAKLANEYGVKVQSSYISSAKAYHQSIGRDTRGGGSTWTVEKVAQIANADMTKPVATSKSMIAIGKLIGTTARSYSGKINLTAKD